MGPDSIQQTTYYSDSLSRRPVRIMWLATRNSSLPIRITVFTTLLGRKLVESLTRRRFPARYGTPIPTSLLIIDEKQVPHSVVTAVAEAWDACRAAGFELVFWYKGRHIGGMESYSIVALDVSRTVYATVIWLRYSFGKSTNANVVLSCHSRARDGRGIHTARETGLEQDVNVPPGHDRYLAAAGSKPAEILHYHREIIGPVEDLDTFTSPAEVEGDLTLTGQQLFAHLIATRQLFPLTDTEVRKLKPPADSEDTFGDFVL